MVNETAELPAGLRSWAQGDRARTAAVELFIRHGRFNTAGAPWVLRDDAGSVYLDAEVLRVQTGAYSSGEVVVAEIIASLLGGDPIDLADATARLGYRETDLVLSAIATAAGFDAPSKSIEVVDGRARRIDLPALRSWDDETSTTESSL